ncbi:MAG TPA: Stp1/IreP family PP2C-type Ser/Thr phosphatase [Thermoleophilia bacterium]|nr:Stp1/IreP family PP2C-type Ser/Thr phosphatase [Thermoleophilia bacterium]
MIRLTHGAATHLGLVRRQNEDSFVGEPGLYAVCDGMGGARAGEVASELACRVLADLPKNVGEPELREAIAKANRMIRDRSLADSELSGMGTTLTAAVRSGSALTIAQVGDSRAYLFHDGELRQVTCDHSLVAEMIRSGRLTPEEAAVHPHRSIITRALGTEELVNPDFFVVSPVAGDKVLLCSDGLSGMVPDDEVQELLARADDPQDAADLLVAAALRHGGEDNVTVVVIFAEESSGGGSGGGFGEEPDGGLDGGPGSGSAVPSDADASDLAGRAFTTADGFGPLVAETDGASDRSFFGGRRRLVTTIVIAALAAAVAAAAFLTFNSTVFFVGTTQGQVVLFQGMPYRVMGVELYGMEESVPVHFEELDMYLQERVDAHELVTKEEGLRFIRGLETTP